MGGFVPFPFLNDGGLQFREMGSLEYAIRAAQQGAFNGVAQFPEIAWPGVPGEGEGKAGQEVDITIEPLVQLTYKATVGSAAPDERLAELIQPFLAEIGVPLAGIDGARLGTVVALTKVRVRTLKEMAEMMKPLLSDDYQTDPDAAAKHLTPEGRGNLARLADSFAAVPDFSVPLLEDALRKLALELNVKAAVLIHPCRVALTGKTVGPPLFDVIQVLGKETTIKRLRG